MIWRIPNMRTTEYITEVSFEAVFERQNCYQVFDDDGNCIDIVDTEREAMELADRYCGYYI